MGVSSYFLSIKLKSKYLPIHFLHTFYQLENKINDGRDLQGKDVRKTEAIARAAFEIVAASLAAMS